MSLLVDVLINVFGDCREHNPYHGQASFNCPYCDDGKNKGNLEVNYFKGVFNCWSCGVSNGTRGKLPRIVKNFATAEQFKDFKLFYDPQEDKIEKHVIEDLKLPDEYLPLYYNQNRDKKTQQAISYLKKRGIDNKIIDEYKIGCCLNGRYFNRIVIPSYDKFNNLNYFITRDYSGKARNKYDNPRSDKSDIIINECKINYESDIYLVEGMFDHIVIHNSIPLLGLVLHDYLYDNLLLNAKANIIIFLDGEAYDDALYIYERLNDSELKGRVKLVKVTDGYDPSIINEKFGKRGIKHVLSTSKFIKKREVF